MIIIGLTGSIGMGKTTVAEQFSELGAKIFSADEAVHTLLEANKHIIEQIAKEFAGVVENKTVDRTKLATIVFSDEDSRRKLEALLHPDVFVMQDQFLDRSRKAGEKAVVLEIPLLFETGADSICDITVVASATEEIQKQRVMQRPHMTEEKFAAIVKAQMPDEQKRKMANHVIETGNDKAHSFAQVKQIMDNIHDA